MTPVNSPVSAECDATAELLAGAALDALAADEQLELQRHLATCERCTAHLAELRNATAALALVLPSEDPSPALRDRLHEAIRREPREHHPSRPLRLLPGRRLSPTWAAIAAALVVSAGSLAWAASLQVQLAQVIAQAQEDRQRAARYDRIVGVLASEQLVARDLRPPSDAALPARGTIYLDPSSQTGMAMLHDLPPLPPGRAWQLWFVRGAERVSGGLLRVDATGTGYTLLRVPPDLQTFDSVGITEEPAGGSPAPTTPRVVGASL